MSQYQVEQYDSIKETTYYVCPIKSQHHLHSVSEFIDHLCHCEESSNYRVKKFICRFNHFHWFKTGQERATHEFFICENKENVMPQNEVIINQLNEVMLPLNKDQEFQLRQYFKKGNVQARPNLRNFLNDFKHNQVEKEFNQKRVKL